MFERGKIVLVPFPFTDLSSQKIRPALILTKQYTASRDIVVLFISSVLTKVNPYHFLIKTDNKTFPQTGLKVTSVVVCDKLATLDKSIVIGEIGECSSAQMKEISRRVKLALGL